MTLQPDHSSEGHEHTAKYWRSMFDDQVRRKRLLQERYDSLHRASRLTFEAAGNGPDALGDALVDLGLVLAGEKPNEPIEETENLFFGVGPTVGYCSKCGEAREAFYTCRDGGHTVPKEQST